VAILINSIYNLKILCKRKLLIIKTKLTARYRPQM